MKKISRVNFQHPQTGESQVGFGYIDANVWHIRTYGDQVLMLLSVNAVFESYNRSVEFCNEFFKSN